MAVRLTRQSVTAAQQQEATVRLTRQSVTAAQQQEATVRLTRLSVVVARQALPDEAVGWGRIPIGG